MRGSHPSRPAATAAPRLSPPQCKKLSVGSRRGCPRRYLRNNQKNVLQAAMTRCKSVMHYVQEKRLATLSRATAASLFVAMMVSINEVADGD